MALRRLLFDVRHPLGVWLAGAAAAAALVGWIALVAFWFVDVWIVLAALIFLSPLGLAPLAPLWCYRAGRPFRPAATLAAAVELVGGTLLVWVGGVVFWPAGALLAFAALFGATRPAAHPG